MTTPPPEGLGDAGRALWAQVLDTPGWRYRLRPDELATLAHACFEQDAVARLQAEAEGSPVTTRGAYGQMTANPVWVELRQHRALLNRLLGQLKLPDQPGAKGGHQRTPDEISEQARRAARARWDRYLGTEGA